MRPTLSIIIANWNGIAFLQRCLSATLLSAQASGCETEVLLIDDASTDGSAEQAARDFPSLHVLRNIENSGFGATCNRGARQAQGDILIFVNNDLVPREPMVAELTAPLLADDQLFAVSGKTVEWDGHTPNHVNMAASMQDGQFTLTFDDATTLSPTMFVQGGCCAMRRDRFLDFGGFHPIFSPGYWEDYDISYRALKSGWRNLYNPKAVGNHLGQGSMVRAHGARSIAITRQRNREFFQWLNFTDEAFIQSITASLPTRVASAFAEAGEGRLWLRGWMKALAAWPEVEKERRNRTLNLKRSDSDIFAEFADRGRPCP